MIRKTILGLLLCGMLYGISSAQRIPYIPTPNVPTPRVPNILPDLPTPPRPTRKIRFYRYRITNLTNFPIFITHPSSSIKGPKRIDGKTYRLGHHRVDRDHIFYMQDKDGSRRYFKAKRNFNNPTTSIYFKYINKRGAWKGFNYDGTPLETWVWKNLTPPNIIY